MSRLTFGKYNGATYEQTLAGDLNYCQYIHSLPTNDRIAEFQNWLSALDLNGKARIHLAEDAMVEKRASALRKLYSRAN